MKDIKITIGMPVFNDVNFIEASLISIINQTEPNFKLIISDDGSTDGSADICKSYAAKDSRITYIRQEKNLGISKNMEFLLKQAETEYFMWAGDDDLLEPNFIEKHISALENNKIAIVSFSKYNMIDDNDEIIRSKDVNYSSSLRFFQLLKLIWFFDDGFGYGVFKTEKIRRVKFPIWWWPNKKTPYNNIYPSLCFYLNNGKYLHNDEVLFSKRSKSPKNVNHIIGGSGNGLKELLSYYLRRFYLINYSFIQMLKSYTFFNAFLVYPFMFAKWFIWDSLVITYESFSNKFR